MFITSDSIRLCSWHPISPSYRGPQRTPTKCIRWGERSGLGRPISPFLSGPPTDANEVHPVGRGGNASRLNLQRKFT